MSELTITDARLRPIADKVLAGVRLSVDDGITLYRTPDLLAVGWLANHVREKRHGNITYYNNAFTLSMAPIMLIGTAVSTAAFPRLNQRLAAAYPCCAP